MESYENKCIRAFSELRELGLRAVDIYWNTVWLVIFAGVKFCDFESKRYTKFFSIFKFGDAKKMSANAK
jgi:hypothetical protein